MKGAIMKIDTSASLIQNSLSQAVSAANIMGSNPIEGSIGLMKAENGITAAAKVIKAKDEMLGTILDILA